MNRETHNASARVHARTHYACPLPPPHAHTLPHSQPQSLKGSIQSPPPKVAAARAWRVLRSAVNYKYVGCPISFYPGMRVVHSSGRRGTVGLSPEGDKRLIVLFDNTEIHKYGPAAVANGKIVPVANQVPLLSHTQHGPAIALALASALASALALALALVAGTIVVGVG